MTEGASGEDFFEEDSWRSERAEADRLMLNIDGFEGPLDVLLMLARAQKVDLAQISILELVEQYMAFMVEAKSLRLELAADYLVMASWLLYLKSRLLLPKDDDEEEPTAEELALRLQLRLQRLDAMRECGAQLMGRNRLGRDIWGRGAPEGVVIDRYKTLDVSLFELLKAYGAIQHRNSVTEITIKTRPVFALEDAIERLSALVGDHIDWAELSVFLPSGLDGPALRKSAIASHFVASLELARQGRADLQQQDIFGPLMIRGREASHDR